VRARAAADPQSRSVSSALASQNQFSRIRKLIGEQNRKELSRVAKVGHQHLSACQHALGQFDTRFEAVGQLTCTKLAFGYTA
jgi:hypothetical protein